MVEIRKMEPTESKEVKKIALKAFGLGIERLFISKPKDAMVALMNGKIVGGINTKYITSGSHKIGYYDTAFIDPIYHGQGIGKLLYEKTTEQFWNDKCTALSALVKDDNVSSWKLFLNNGFKQVSILEVIRHLGITATLKLYFTTPFFIGNGMEHYLAVKDSPVKSKNINTAKQLLLFFLPILFRADSILSDNSQSLNMLGSKINLPMYDLKTLKASLFIIGLLLIIRLLTCKSERESILIFVNPYNPQFNAPTNIRIDAIAVIIFIRPP